MIGATTNLSELLEKALEISGIEPAACVDDFKCNETSRFGGCCSGHGCRLRNEASHVHLTLLSELDRIP